MIGFGDGSGVWGPSVPKSLPFRPPGLSELETVVEGAVQGTLGG